jgi:DNA-binding CsgD family transcriptional regulator
LRGLAPQETRIWKDLTQSIGLDAMDERAPLQKIQLSKRERECVAFILLGLTTPEISRHLKLSARTIESYIENVKAKLGCSRKSEIATFAIRFQLNILYRDEFEKLMQAYLVSNT